MRRFAAVLEEHEDRQRMCPEGAWDSIMPRMKRKRTRGRRQMSETILVTAIGSFSAVTVIQALKKEGHRVIGCDIYPAEWVANSKLVDVCYQAPYATDRPAYEAFVKQVCKEHAVSFVMPLTDVEIDLFRKWETAAEDTGAVICMSERKNLDIIRNKKKLESYLTSLGICETIPGDLLPDVVDNLKNSDDTCGNLEYPLVIKPVDGRSSQGLHIAHSAKEMELIVELCRDRLDQYLVQPKISGAVITVDVVRNPKTEECVCIPRRELLRTPNGAGTSVCVFRNEHLEEQCRAIARALGICGCVNFEFIEEKMPEKLNGAGVWRFLECNPRFSGGLGFSAVAGYDMVKNHLNCFCGRNLEPLGEIREQYIARRYEEFVM